MNSLDNWKSIETDPFFYTRLRVRIKNNIESTSFNWFFDSPLLRPSLIAIALLINILSINYYLSHTEYFQEQSTDFAAVFNDEYLLDQSTESYIVFNNE